MTTALVPVQDLERMARAVAASKLFGVQNVEQAMALMLVAQAEGLHPATAARDYHIIQGRPALKADAMLARYLNSGGKVEWHEHTDSRVSATFTHPAGGSLKIEWDMDRAKKAGLTGKDNWTKYPRQMLRARVISEGIRATNPAVAVGVYTVEETQDFEDKPRRGRSHEPKDMGAAAVVEDDPDITQHIPGAGKDAPQVSAPQVPPSSPPTPPAEAAFISVDQAIALEDALKASGRSKEKLLANVARQYGTKVERLSQIKSADYADAMEYASGA